jgi:hypothetical protein
MPPAGAWRRPDVVVTWGSTALLPPLSTLSRMQEPPGPDDGAQDVSGPAAEPEPDTPTGPLDRVPAAGDETAAVPTGPPTDPWGWTTDAKGNPVPPATTGAAAATATAAAGVAGAAATGDVAGADAGRSRRHARSRHWTHRRLATVGTAAAVVLAGIGVGSYVLASGPAAAKGRATGTTIPRTTTTVRRVKAVKAVRRTPTCPLTGLPAPGGKVPQRPVLAVKVGNDPDARPQSGLEDADIVFDTLAEGGITRYIAVYQCGNASAIGPIRSVRWDDWHVLQMFGRADLAFVNGINPDIDTVAGIPWICDLDAFENSNAYFQNPDRGPPESTYSSTAALWGACPKAPAPPPVFDFSSGAAAGSGPVASVDVDYSYDADVIWQWSPAHHAFLHFYEEGGSAVPDVDDQGQQLQATNVVIEVVNIEYGPYEESPGSTGDVEAQLVGTGTAYVLRNGRVERGTWSHPSWSDIPVLTTTDGKPMTLEPGNTWVELVPTFDSVTITP